MRTDGNRAALRWALLLCLACAAAAPAADGNLNVPASSIIATFRQQGVAVEAPFRRFTGTLSYDAANPAATSATLSVEVASLDVGDEASNAELGKAAWFDSARFPQAVFHSTAVKPGAAGRLEATGTLAIKGRTQPLTVGITVTNAGRTHGFDGTFAISRHAFGIGDPSWDEVLEDSVTVRFHLLAGP